MKPHSVSLAKALTSAYFPIGAITIEEDLYQAMLEKSKKIGTFGHGYTYTAHPVGCAVALKTIEIYERDRIVDHVRTVAPAFAVALRQACRSPAGRRSARRRPDRRRRDGRRQGDPAPLRSQAWRRLQFVQFAQEHGLICRMLGDSVAFCPPLVINDDEIDEMFDMYERALADTEAWVTKEGLRRP